MIYAIFKNIKIWIRENKEKKELKIF